MTDKAVATAASGLAAQRGKTSPAHQAVPGDALATAAGPAGDGDGPAVTGGTVTVAGQGFLDHRGQKGPLS